jgi:hypothetical protein
MCKGHWDATGEWQMAWLVTYFVYRIANVYTKHWLKNINKSYSARYVNYSDIEFKVTNQSPKKKKFLIVDPDQLE